MHFEMRTEPDGRSGIGVSQLHDDDAVVGDTWFWLDSPLVGGSPDVLAASAVLAYGHLLGSVIRAPEGMGKSMASAVYDFLGRRHLRPISVGPDVCDMHRGFENHLNVGDPHRDLDSELPWTRYDLRLLPGDQFVGQQVSRIAVAIPSNADFFAARLRVPSRSRVLAAAALLVAERLEVGTIWMEDDLEHRSDLLLIGAMVRAAGFHFHTYGAE